MLHMKVKVNIYILVKNTEYKKLDHEIMNLSPVQGKISS